VALQRFDNHRKTVKSGSISTSDYRRGKSRDWMTMQRSRWPATETNHHIGGHSVFASASESTISKISGMAEQ
jgi:hypothetical protein